MHGRQTDARAPRLARIGLIAGPALALVLLLFVDLDAANPAVTRTAAVAVLMAVWWISEAVPLAVTALLPMILFPALGVLSGKNVAPIYFSHIIFLFIGGFLVAIAMERWQLHRRIALRTLMTVGGTPRLTLLGFMAATAFLSMWISNTATAMMMVPIALALIVKLGQDHAGPALGRFATAIFLGIAYSASIGGLATLVGTPPNLSFVRILAIQFPDAPELSFAQWLAFGLPLAMILLTICWCYLAAVYTPRRAELQISRAASVRQYRELGRMGYQERMVLAVFALLVVLWLFREPINLGFMTLAGWAALFPEASYLNDGVVAIAAALLLFIIPARSPDADRLLDADAIGRLPWDIVLLFGGGFALAQGFKASGLSMWVGRQLTAAGSLHPLILVLLVCLLITFLTELTSNTATAEILLPVLAAMAIELKLNPLLLMVPGTLACSCAFMLPVATPPNAIVFGTRRLQMVDMARAGLALNLIGVIVVGLGTWFLGRIVFDIDPAVMPAWAVPSP